MTSPAVHDGDDTTAWPPGTVRLEERGAAAGKALILQPYPSDDPNDPLNWPQWRKYVNFGLTCFYVMMVVVLIDAATPTWAPMNEELGFSYAILNDSYALGCGALGIGSLVMIPFALKFGRRPIYLISTLAQFGISIWSAKQRTVVDLLLVNVFSCGFGALSEVIVQMTIADIFFVHERGLMNAIYIWNFNIGGSLGPLVAGYITTGQGWRWVWWWNAIFFAICVVLFAFCYEETKYEPPSRVSTSRPESSPGNEHVESQASGIGATKSTHKMKSSIDVEGVDDVVKSTHSIQKVFSQPTAADVEIGMTRELHKVSINPNIPLKTYWQRLSLTTSSPGGLTYFARHVYQPLVLLVTVPAIFYVAFIYGILVGMSNIMTTTQSTYLPYEPYNFTADKIGLMSLPSIIGVTLGSLIVGPISDWLIVYLAHRNNGIYEPETRLWCMVPFIPFLPAGAIMFSIGLQNGSPWPVIAVGSALYSFGVAPVNSIVITYVTDSYTEIVGDALVGVTFVRNAISTSLIFALTPWIAAVGIKYAMTTMVVIASFVLLCSGIFIKWGKNFRTRTADRYSRYSLKQAKGRE